MSSVTHTFLSALGFFFVYAIIQSVISTPKIKRIYLLYATYLSFIFIYFFLKEFTPPDSGVDIGNIDVETFLTSAIIATYLFFAKAFFYGRESYQYFRAIANAGLYAVLLCLVIEQLLDYFNVPPINLIEGFLRGILALMGIYAITITYIKAPQDRNISRYFIFGNYLVLFGIIVSASLTITGSSMHNFRPDYNQYAMWIKTFELLPVQIAIILEMFCFSIAIVKLQLILPKNHVETLPTFNSTKEGSIIQKIAFKTSTGFEVIKKQDIILIEGGGNSANFVKIYIEGNQSPISVLHTLANCLNLLSDEQNTFIQPHKSFIINIQKLKSLNKDKDGVEVLLMCNKKEIPIPRGKKEVIKKLLKLS